MKNADILLIENHAAAQSLKNWWTRLASTYGCMKIVLSRKKVTIKPHWFASWLIRLLRLDLYHEIPLESIGKVNEIGRWYSYGKVRLKFQISKERDRKIILYMKRSAEFVERLSRTMHQ
jgi:hypothetical protein